MQKWPEICGHFVRNGTKVLNAFRREFLLTASGSSESDDGEELSFEGDVSDRIEICLLFVKFRQACRS
jgi:hypothetical protein